VSIPCRLGTPTYKLQIKTRSRTCTHMAPRALQHQTLLSSQGGLRGYHVSNDSRSHLPDRKGSSTATCTVTLDPASLQGRAPVHHVSYSFRSCLPPREGSSASRVLQLRILPPSKGGLRCATCLAAPDPASLQGRALECSMSYSSRSSLPAGEGFGTPCVLRLRILPPYRGGLQCRQRMPYGFL
jgi:hypothetical protein